MPEWFVIYCLSVYLLFHLASRAVLFNRPRTWVVNHLPARLVYPLTCCLCFSWWFGVFWTLLWWVASGTLVLSAAVLLAAPAANMVLDLLARYLIRMNEPPVISVPSVWTGTAGGGVTWSQQTGVINESPLPQTVSIPTIWVKQPWKDFSFPDSHPQPVGRRVRVRNRFSPERCFEGTIVRQYIDNDDCAGSFGKPVYSVSVEGGETKVDLEMFEVTFLDDPDTPFNPLDHEQTK